MLIKAGSSLVVPPKQEHGGMLLQWMEEAMNRQMSLGSKASERNTYVEVEHHADFEEVARRIRDDIVHFQDPVIVSELHQGKYDRERRCFLGGGHVYDIVGVLSNGYDEIEGFLALETDQSLVFYTKEALAFRMDQCSVVESERYGIIRSHTQDEGGAKSVASMEKRRADRRLENMQARWHREDEDLARVCARYGNETPQALRDGGMNEQGIIDLEEAFAHQELSAYGGHRQCIKLPHNVISRARGRLMINNLPSLRRAIMSALTHLNSFAYDGLSRFLQDTLTHLKQEVEQALRRVDQFIDNNPVQYRQVLTHEEQELLSQISHIEAEFTHREDKRRARQSRWGMLSRMFTFMDRGNGSLEDDKARYEEALAVVREEIRVFNTSH